MSRPRFWWYENIVRIIKAFPALAVRDDLTEAEDRAREAVASALDVCTDEEKEVIRLNVWKGLTLEQTAAAVFTSERTAQSRRIAFVYRVAREYGYIS